MFAFQKRYSFKRALLVTGICFGLVLLLQILVITFTGEHKKLLSELCTLKKILSLIGSLLYVATFFYLSVNHFYELFVQRKPFKNHLLVTVLSVIAYAIYNVLALAMEDNEEKRKFSVAVLAFSIVFTSVLVTGIAFLIAYLTSLRDEQKQRKILEQQKLELEVQNSQANFNFLKAQINPHFLHNTLNFFYAKALPLSAELSEGILCLSDIMRYALNEGGKDEKSLLKDEIEHLENVIRINQLRFSNNLNVQLEVKGDIGGVMIVPFVLITLVENAFKHGDLKNSEHPIIIHIEVEGKRLYFYCRNKKNPGFKEISTGIGLQNILKRLQIMYGTSYSYSVTDEPEFYTTELTIDPL